MTQKYVVGDKVRILNVDGIWLARELGYKNGDIAEVIRLASKGQPFIPAKNGGKLVIARSEFKYIEKVAEQMTKFNVGDTVRAITDKYGMTTKSAGWEGVVTEVAGGKFDAKTTKGKYSTVDFVYNGLHVEDFELVNAKSTQDKPKKKARISALEQQVAELTAKVEALEKAGKPTAKLADTAEVFFDGKSIGKVKAVEARVLSANEQRKANIAEAKAFVEDLTAYINPKSQFYRPDHPKYGEIKEPVAYHVLVPYFTVKAETREVNCVLKCAVRDVGVVAKAIAKCAPDDVFNADIGKAIALGRALGLDVKRFEQAVKPTELVPGIVTQYGKVKAVRPTHRESNGFRFNGHEDGFTTTDKYETWHTIEYAEITDDTDAQY